MEYTPSAIYFVAHDPTHAKKVTAKALSQWSKERQQNSCEAVAVAVAVAVMVRIGMAYKALFAANSQVIGRAIGQAIGQAIYRAIYQAIGNKSNAVSPRSPCRPSPQ